MEALTSAVSVIGAEMTKLKEENEFLKKKMAEMFTEGQLAYAYKIGKHDGKKRSLDSFIIPHKKGTFRHRHDWEAEDLIRVVRRH